jgi:hypothetical protein
LSKFRDEWLKRKQMQPGKFWPWVRPLIWKKAQEYDSSNLVFCENFVVISSNCVIDFLG